ncbi:MAG: M20/M25/M40 family metallo-hydrolase [Bacteroidetes bacterium]|nr:M20/M25/M40 family metallo-hydrolase [Bacteroidota bacterium]
MTTSDIARHLIDIPSVTGEETAVLHAIEDILTEMGIPVIRQPVAENRWNIIAGWYGDNAIVFSTHVDTVPPWYASHIDGEMIYGRGACDTKGIIAAMLTAGIDLLARGIQPAYLFVVGEETDSVGAKTAAASGLRASALIVGEPTDNHLASGHKGVISYTLRTTGIASHSAYPDRGHSAIHQMLDLLADVRSAEWGRNDILGESTLNIGMFSGGVALNTFAPSAEAAVMHRIVDDSAARKIQVEHIIGDRADITFHTISEAQFLETLPGFPVKSVNFGTDIPHLRPIGRCFLVGPGSVHDAHTDHEKISSRDMDDATALYVRLHTALREQE